MNLFMGYLKKFVRELYKFNLGLVIVSRNLYLLRIRRIKRMIFHGHLGLGDQICYATLYERWNDLGLEILIPCHPHYQETLKKMYAYLSNIHFYGLPKGSHASMAGAIAKKYRDWPIIVSGYETQAFITHIYPKGGLGKKLILSVGYLAPTLYSDRFRSHIFTLPQLDRPEKKYAFVNRRSSEGLRKMPNKGFWDDSLPTLEETIEYPIFSYGKIMDEAHELRSAGSAFLCFAIVLGARSRYKYFVSNYSLLTDDTNNEWILVPAD